jgi:DNA-binding transcriptional regulator LsrR (DeoR family)
MVTIYHAIDGMTQSEIAEVLGCSRRHVGHLLERAVQWARSLDEVRK